MKCATDQSKESSEDKWDELLFMRLLLVHGGDPEPYKSIGTGTYLAWMHDIEDTFMALDHSNDREAARRGFTKYEEWLQPQGLGYVPGTD